MLLTRAAIDEAKKFLNCKEESSNKSACVNEIKALYGIKPNTDPYCAMFVWVCIKSACEKLKIEPPIIQTASTVTLLNASKKKFPVDTIPKKGAIFFYPTTAQHGHVGFVTAVDGKTFNTIEANTTSPTKGEPEGVYEKTRTLGDKKFQFIHLESLDTVENNINSFLIPFGAEIGSLKFNATITTILVGAGLLVAYKKMKKK
jgi:hypothetical protein